MGQDEELRDEARDTQEGAAAAGEAAPAQKPTGKGKKRLLKVLGAIVAAVVVVGAAGFGANAAVTALYWADDYDGIELEAADYEEDVEECWVDYAAMEDAIFEVADQATDVPEEYAELIETCNGYIEKFFSEVYGIEVGELIDAIAVHVLDFDLAGDGYGSVLGMEDPDGGNIYLTVELFDVDGYWYGDEYLLMETYIHEVMHDLGVCAQLDNEMTMLYEGMAEYLTGKCLAYNDVEYTNMSSYTYNSVIAGQIIEADPDLVVSMVGHYGEFRLSDWLDAVLDGYALDLDDALFMLIDYYIDNDLLLRVQYLAAEYCKAVNPDEAQSIVDGNEIVSRYEWRVLIGELD